MSNTKPLEHPGSILRGTAYSASGTKLFQQNSKYVHMMWFLLQGRCQKCNGFSCFNDHTWHDDKARSRGKALADDSILALSRANCKVAQELQTNALQPGLSSTCVHSNKQRHCASCNNSILPLLRDSFKRSQSYCCCHSDMGLI